MALRNLIDGVQEALLQEMERDPRVVLLGEDVGVRGGVFQATKGLVQAFGEPRVIDAPLAESSIVGVAIGMALNGLHPVAEIQFADFIYPAFNQIVSEAARICYRSNGDFCVPMVIRAPYGGGVHGALYHSQSVEALFGHIPGLKIAIPSTAADAKGLLLSAMRDPNPVLFLEHKGAYRLIKGEIPAGDNAIPLGEAALRREGSDLTLVGWGLMSHFNVLAAQTLSDEGIDCDVIDLRTIAPLDREAVLRSVRKTHRLLIVYEDTRTGGFGAEIAATVAEEALFELDAPIGRVSGPDVPAMPFNHTQEAAFMPKPETIAAAARDLMKA